MKFKRFMSAGLAAATGLTLAMAGSSAQANVTGLMYTSVGTIPILQLNIGIESYDLDGNASTMDDVFDVYDFHLSTEDGTGFADLFGFAYDWNLDGTKAMLIESSVTATDNSNPANTFTPDVQVCFNTINCTPPNNLNGGAVLNDGTKADGDWDNFYRFGTTGVGQNDFIDGVNFKVAVVDTSGSTDMIVDAVGPLVDGVPLSRLAARAQTTQNPDTTTATQSMQFGSGDSLKFGFYVCSGSECDGNNNEGDGDPVPEIDGPVLIQVGFALGGLYLLLLGRRRQEDELAHAA